MDINAQICLAFGSLPITQRHNVQFRWIVSVMLSFMECCLWKKWVVLTSAKVATTMGCCGCQATDPSQKSPSSL